MYSQNNEEQIIVDYFKGFKGSLLDVGANDGETYSNSLRLIQKGWKADLVEPSPEAFKRLSKLHLNNQDVELHNVAIANENKTIDFFVSGSLVSKDDINLVSTAHREELKRWNSNVSFEKIKVNAVTIATLFKDKSFDFITIDVEGYDYDVLTQLNLTNTKMVIVEFNGKEKDKYIKYCSKFDLKLIALNGENLIFAK